LRNKTFIAQVKDIIWGNHWVTVQEVAEETKMSIGLLHAILTEDRGLCQVSAKLVPKLLTESQRIWCVTICQDLQQNKCGWTLLKNISGDKTWVYG
jgi:hypothetical protein